MRSERVTGKRRPLWTCPKCGHRFVTRNIWHSCGRYRLADHFEGADPVVREMFNRFRAILKECGPMTIYPQKTRITCQVRVRFANAVPRKRWLDVGLWLTRRVEHRKIRRVEEPVPRCYVHSFRFEEPADLDEGFAAILQEAYAVGCQEHLGTA
jgi:hypothetical protein